MPKCARPIFSAMFSHHSLLKVPVFGRKLRKCPSVEIVKDESFVKNVGKWYSMYTVIHTIL